MTETPRRDTVNPYSPIITVSCPRLSHIHFLSDRQAWGKREDQTGLATHLVHPYACIHRSFRIESSTVISGKVLAVFPSDSLHTCLHNCSQKPECRAANYVMSTGEEPHCLLVDTRHPGNASQLPVEQHGLYAATRFCVQEAFATRCPGRHWSFERFANRRLLDSRFSLELREIATLEECLEECVVHGHCLAVLWQDSKHICELASISLQAVHNPRQFFAYDKETDLYESNCAHGASSAPSCSFLNLPGAGIIDHFDERIGNVPNADSCENICLDKGDDWGICRMYTFDSRHHTCYLSHSASRALGRSPLEDGHRPYLATGELDDCVQLSIKCKPESLELHSESLKLFGGELKTKKASEVMCQRSISPNYAFQLELPYQKCGIEKQTTDGSSFGGTLYLKEGSTQLVTIRDKVIKVNCRIHTQMEPMRDQTVAVHMHVSAGNDTRLRNGLIVPTGPLRYQGIMAHPNSPYRLNFTRSGPTKIGQLVIEMGDPEGGEFTVRNVVALLGPSGPTQKPHLLIDGEGCVVDRAAVRQISRQIPGQLIIDIDLTAFGEATEVVYQSLIEPCSYNCMPSCNHELLKDFLPAKTMRRRRSLPAGRALEISQDVYKISGGRTKLMALEPPNGSGEVEVEEVWSAALAKKICHGTYSELHCVASLLVIFLFLSLAIVSVSIACYYGKQYRRHQQLIRPPIGRVEYEFREESIQK
ncbi:unnamed protein product, partial [Mesorhabditis spiculigera]